jgi:cyanophycinase
MARQTAVLFLWLLAACAADKSGIRVIDASTAVYEVPAASNGAAVEPIAQRNGRGPLVLHGGGVFQRDVAGIVVALAGADPRLCLIDTADDGRGQIYRLFDGFRDVHLSVLNLRPGDAALPDVIATLRGCTGFFFGGGAPERLSLAFRPNGHDTPALAAIRERFERNGAVVAGSSAGAMIVGPVTLCECGAQSSTMAVTRGELFRAPGFDLLDVPVLIDAHFFARGLLGRHMFALARERLPVGVGIDEGTTVLVPGDGGPWRVLGGRAVALVRTPADAETDRLYDFGFSVLFPKDRFDPLSNKVAVAPERQQLAAEDIPRLMPDSPGIKYSYMTTGETRSYARASRTETTLDALVSVDPL